MVLSFIKTTESFSLRKSGLSNYQIRRIAGIVILIGKEDLARGTEYIKSKLC